MNKYRVTVKEVIIHGVDIEADTEEEAGAAAIAAVIEDDRSFFMEVEDRHVHFIMEK